MFYGTYSSLRTKKSCGGEIRHVLSLQDPVVEEQKKKEMGFFLPFYTGLCHLAGIRSPLAENESFRFASNRVMQSF